MSQTEEIYRSGKNGKWDEVVSFLTSNTISVVDAIILYRNSTSGYTLLHQAAWWGNEDAVKLILRFVSGRQSEVRCNNGKLAVDVAREKGHDNVAKILATHLRFERIKAEPSIWGLGKIVPSSRAWEESRKTTAEDNLQVMYAGALISIKKGKTIYRDSANNILVGWHGTYSPPRGMDGEPMV